MLYNHSANQQHRKVCPQLVFVYSFAGRQLARFTPAVIVTSHLFALLGLRQLHIWHFWITDPIRPNPTRPIWTDLFVIKWPHFMWGFKVFNKTQVNSLSFCTIDFRIAGPLSDRTNLCGTGLQVRLTNGMWSVYCRQRVKYYPTCLLSGRIVCEPSK